MTLHYIQALRAIAALLVVADHTLLNVVHDQSPTMTQLAGRLGSAGVYLFFVISGFIMVHICWKTFGQKRAAVDFLRRRVIRIVPLYWFATIAAFAYHRVSATHGANADLSELLYSLAFIPHANNEGLWEPVLPQGWTLNYEMMFYLIFALSLFLPRHMALPALGLTLAAIVIAGPIMPNEALQYLASPIVLWFLFGVGLGTIWRWRDLKEPKWVARLGKPLGPLGDSSYSTYLVHGLVLTMLLRVWLMTAGPPSVWILFVSLAVATLAGWVIYSVFERPLLQKLGNFRRPIGKSASIRKFPDRNDEAGQFES